jgi:hypothetical protein
MKMKVIQSPCLPSELELWASVPSIFQVNDCFSSGQGVALPLPPDWPVSHPLAMGHPHMLLGGTLAIPRGWRREAAAAYGGDGS